MKQFNFKCFACTCTVYDRSKKKTEFLLKFSRSIYAFMISKENLNSFFIRYPNLNWHASIEQFCSVRQVFLKAITCNTVMYR